MLLWELFLEHSTQMLAPLSVQRDLKLWKIHHSSPTILVLSIPCTKCNFIFNKSVEELLPLFLKNNSEKVRNICLFVIEKYLIFSAKILGVNLYLDNQVWDEINRKVGRAGEREGLLSRFSSLE